MIASWNVKLSFPSEETSARYLKILEDAKNCYNFLSDLLEQDGYRNHIESSITVQKRYYKKLRQHFQGLTSQMIIEVTRRTVANWKSAYRLSGKNFETPHTHGLLLNLDKRLYSKLTTNSICLTLSGAKRVECTFKPYPTLNHFFETYKTGSCDIFYRDRQFWLSIQFDVKTPESSGAITALGIDSGIRRIAACSDGTGWINKEFNSQRRKLRYLRRCLKSKGTKSAKRHLKKIQRAERNRSRNEVHRVVNWLLAKPFDTYVIEDLKKIKKQTSKTKVKTSDGDFKEIKRRRHNNLLGQIPMYLMRAVLEYKAPLLGKKVETVKPNFTSQLDCRGISNGTRRGTRYYASDGVVLDADGNAACNILLREHPGSTIALPIYGSMVFSGRHPSTCPSWMKLKNYFSSQAAALSEQRQLALP